MAPGHVSKGALFVKTWFTSDLHFGHKKVIEFCKRPFKDIYEMDIELIKRWNARVAPDDEVYVLGDVCFHNPASGIGVLRMLKGHKILVRGNHDKYSLTQYHQAGFAPVTDEIILTFKGRRIKLSHFPFAPSAEEAAKMQPHDLRYLDRRPKNDGSPLLCGHVHEKWKVRDRMFNVGVDANNYEPVSGSVIEKWLATV